MSKAREAVYVKCPYYRREDRQGRKIQCEGLLEGTEQYQRFPSLEALKKQKMSFCNRKDFAKCPVADALDRKYGYER